MSNLHIILNSRYFMSGALLEVYREFFLKIGACLVFNSSYIFQSFIEFDGHFYRKKGQNGDGKLTHWCKTEERNRRGKSSISWLFLLKYIF